MSEPKLMTPDEHERSLDENFPFIEQGATPPPKMVRQTDGAERLVEQTTWSTRHGRAIVRWGSGKPMRISGALFPDGSRGVVQAGLENAWRRHAQDGRRWVHGSIDIRKDDVLFADGPQPAYAVSDTKYPSLERDLANDAKFRAALDDDLFARAAYTVLGRKSFQKSTGPVWSCSEGDAGEMISGMRGLGEIYSDYFDQWGGNALPGDMTEEEVNQWAAGTYSLLRPWRQLLQEKPQGIPDDEIQSMTKQADENLKKVEQLKSDMDEARRRYGSIFKSVYSHFERLGWKMQTK